MFVTPDSVRDAIALVGCSLRGDEEGSRAVKSAADLGEVAETLAWFVAGLLRAVSPACAGGDDPLKLLDRLRDGLATEDGTS